MLRRIANIIPLRAESGFRSIPKAQFSPNEVQTALSLTNVTESREAGEEHAGVLLVFGEAGAEFLG